MEKKYIMLKIKTIAKSILMFGQIQHFIKKH